MKVSKTRIRRAATNYLSWLEDQQWFQINIHNKSDWLNPPKKITSKEVDCPAMLWEAVIDHWHATPWNENSLPARFEHLYLLVEEYRLMHNIDSSQITESTE